jgi:uncharacterized membrane protein
MTLLSALLIGIVSGSRAMLAPAAVAWAGWLGWMDLAPTWAAFLGSGWAVLILSLLAIGELVTDQLPTTPSRKVPVQFGTRLVTGGFSGAALGALAASTPLGLAAGVVGAVAGIYGGAALRTRLAASLGSDHPAAFTEDAAAIVLSLVAVGLA